MQNENTEKQNALYHAGVKGMQKGVRRWTNEDGTLTPEGVEHYRQMYGYEARQQAQKDENNYNIKREKLKFEKEKFRSEQKQEDRERNDILKNQRLERKQALIEGKRERKLALKQSREENETKRQAITTIGGLTVLGLIVANGINRRTLKTAQEMAENARDVDIEAPNIKRKDIKNVAETIKEASENKPEVNIKRKDVKRAAENIVDNNPYTIKLKGKKKPDNYVEFKPNSVKKVAKLEDLQNKTKIDYEKALARDAEKERIRLDRKTTKQAEEAARNHKNMQSIYDKVFSDENMGKFKAQQYQKERDDREKEYKELFKKKHHAKHSDEDIFSMYGIDTSMVLEHGVWNPKDHPRNKFGRFIETGSNGAQYLTSEGRARYNKTITARAKDNADWNKQMSEEINAIGKEAKHKALSDYAKKYGVNKLEWDDKNKIYKGLTQEQSNEVSDVLEQIDDYYHHTYKAFTEQDAINAARQAYYKDIHSGAATLRTETKDLFDQADKLIPNRKGKDIHGDYSNLSDDEMRKAISRIRLENEYADLTGDKKHIKSKEEKAHETLQTVGILLGLGLTLTQIYATIQGTRYGSFSGGDGKKK